MRKGFLICALVLFVSFVCFANESPEMEVEEEEEVELVGGQMLKKALGLSDEQVEKVLQYNEELDTNVTKLSLKIEKKRLELAEMLLDGAKEKDIYRVSDELNNLHAEIQKATLDHYFKVMKILDKDQQKKFTRHYIKRFLRYKGKIKEKIKKKIIEHKG